MVVIEDDRFCPEPLPEASFSGCFGLAKCWKTAVDVRPRLEIWDLTWAVRVVQRNFGE